MPIQVTLVLDSGAFLTNEAATGYAYSEVGYFIPHLNVYGDGEMLGSVNAYTIGTGCRPIEVRHLGSDGKEIANGIHLSQSLIKNLLRIHKLHGRVVHTDRQKFDCCFHFNSGVFRCSHVMPRIFKEVNGITHQLTGQFKTTPPIAHDVVVEYQLEKGESFKIGSGKDDIWSTVSHPNVTKRFDLEVIAENSTAELYYREMLKLGRLNYWLPNQGHPPPNWTHDGDGTLP